MFGAKFAWRVSKMIADPCYGMVFSFFEDAIYVLFDSVDEYLMKPVLLTRASGCLHVSVAANSPPLANCNFKIWL